MSAALDYSDPKVMAGAHRLLDKIDAAMACDDLKTAAPLADELAMRAARLKVVISERQAKRTGAGSRYPGIVESQVED